jgi:hypothetical protein
MTIILDRKPGGGTDEGKAAMTRSSPMSHDRTYNIPSEVSAEEGDVIVDGPDGVAVSLTPEAALETSQRLLEGGLMAQGQRVKSRSKAGAADAAD